MSHINPHLSDFLDSQKLAVKSLAYYIDGIVKRRDKVVLGEAITLLESTKKEHKELVQDLLRACYPKRVDSKRIGITGSPGVGKSTFIESVGQHYIDRGHTVGILSIDPSSPSSKGSILGDKTRMNALARKDEVFIRPSPSSEHLGGANEHSFEAIILCEAAGIDVIFLETVGVGQSEYEVKDLCDMTILLVLPGAGDELQGIKKGIVEVADLIVINKADGDRIKMAQNTRKEYANAVHIAASTDKWRETSVVNYSSLEKEQASTLGTEIEKYFADATEKQMLSRNRKRQEDWWLNGQLSNLIREKVEELITQEEGLIKEGTRNGSPFDQLAIIDKSIELRVKH